MTQDDTQAQDLGWLVAAMQTPIFDGGTFALMNELAQQHEGATGTPDPDVVLGELPDAELYVVCTPGPGGELEIAESDDRAALTFPTATPLLVDLPETAQLVLLKGWELILKLAGTGRDVILMNPNRQGEDLVVPIEAIDELAKGYEEFRGELVPLEKPSAAGRRPAQFLDSEPEASLFYPERMTFMDRQALLAHLDEIDRAEQGDATN